MKTLERLLLLIAIVAALWGCGGTPQTCIRPTDSACWFKNTDGQFYRFDRNKMGLVVGIACDCAEWGDAQ